MGSTRKKTWTEPLPEGAELYTVTGERRARWRDDSGKARTAPIRESSDGSLCIVRRSSRYLMKYRDGEGRTIEVSTRCKDKTAARAVLAAREAEVEKVRAGLIGADELVRADHLSAPVAAHLKSHLAALEAKGDTIEHRKNVERCIKRVATDCGFRTLRDVEPSRMESWLSLRTSEGNLGATTRNKYLTVWRSFLRWCCRTGRLEKNPFEWVGRANEAADRRRQPRALTEVDALNMLSAARCRPLHEATLIRRGARRGQLCAKVSPTKRLGFEAMGWERALAYKTGILTGLRVGELAAVTVADIELDGPHPAIHLRAKHSKNRVAASIPLRADLAADLQEWLDHRLETRRAAVKDSGEPTPLRLDPAERLMRVPSVRVFDADLDFAEIAKRDDRNRVACRHALRHTGCTWLHAAGAPVAVVNAWMRHLTGASLAEKTYTDRRMLDVLPWLDKLPDLPLHAEIEKQPGISEARSTGTDGSLPPLLPPATAVSSASESSPVTLASREDGLAAPAKSSQPFAGTARGARELVRELERLKGLEPSTSTLARLRSTTELQPRSGGQDTADGAEGKPKARDSAVWPPGSPEATMPPVDAIGRVWSVLPSDIPHTKLFPLFGARTALVCEFSGDGAHSQGGGGRWRAGRWSSHCRRSSWRRSRYSRSDSVPSDRCRMSAETIGRDAPAS